ncbi:bifunctional diguanylate cyclase/phosphodiesterase [Aeromonas hydrophila]|uniref:bifunctional diguanylate cyclase/phosphodiesterase n=1 Tax=Aeromonas hydrophila TaxID=644 RepID=UPI0003609087|nr:bifunctional diguanylate cyclase/phosphodiesterase [Aeromonas hydrophila]
MMIKGKFLSLAFIMVSFLGVTIWSLFNYDRTFNDMVKYNQLSAWSLAQLELELHGFDEQLSLYRSGQTDAGQLNKAYDIAWNRLDIFLTGQETALIRSRYQASERVGAFFEVLKEYEQDVVNPTPDSARLAEMEGRMNKLLPSIRDLMVMNFTGPSAIKQRQELQQSKEGHVLVLVALLAIGLLILFVVSREMKLQYFLAWNDPLTLLPNRAAFMTRLERLAKGKQPADCTLTICLIELNNFKEVNDSLGYAAGDELLTMVANQIREYAHDQAFIARMGGDEFALFIYGAMPIEHRVPYLVRLLDELRPTVFQADPAHRVRVSMGISQHPITAHKIEELILFADIALDDLPLSQRIFKELKQIHVRIALDDFGTGWSSFSYLMSLSFDKLKIDKSFVSNIETDPRQFMFVESITKLSHQLGLVVVAEGVESLHELQQLAHIGVDEIQGYYYSKPLSPAEFFIYAMTHLAHSAEESVDVSYH